MRIGHFILRDPGLDVRVADALEAALVELVQRIEHGAAVAAVHAGRIFADKAPDRPPPRSDHAGMPAGQKAAAPHPAEKRLAIAASGKRGIRATKAGRSLVSLPRP